MRSSPQPNAQLKKPSSLPPATIPSLLTCLSPCSHSSTKQSLPICPPPPAYSQVQSSSLDVPPHLAVIWAHRPVHKAALMFKPANLPPKSGAGLCLQTCPAFQPKKDSRCQSPK
ncbi:hypothetical protein L873DRAFT_980250 [Choiromyces venosus 120613-1]|uniref:Uncharacterized protein n=1 Tax=Choiromyces venosus 120613-1 TaxID=1336337 RepID=A0A3N4JLB9_9PEZI|nr:hypothetical protein L873DRAFT_980250 [Choiromyces venosus 120613-1]